jgi:hypothetical protein
MEFNHSLAGYFFSRFLLVGLFSFLVQKKENISFRSRDWIEILKECFEDTSVIQVLSFFFFLKKISILFC